MPTPVEISGARRRAQREAVVIGAMAFAAYWGLIVADAAVPVRMICAAVLIVAVVATATSIMHDANHGALTYSARINRVLGYSADLFGASSWLCRFKHNHLHHGNTNVVDVAAPGSCSTSSARSAVAPSGTGAERTDPATEP